MKTTMFRMYGVVLHTLVGMGKEYRGRVVNPH